MTRRATLAAVLAASLLVPACVGSAPVVAVAVVDPDDPACPSVDRCDGRVLLVDVGVCQAGGLQIDTAENEERVRIAVRARGGGGDCATTFTLTLEEPLGDRKVVDAVTNQEIAVTR